MQASQLLPHQTGKNISLWTCLYAYWNGLNISSPRPKVNECMFKMLSTYIWPYCVHKDCYSSTLLHNNNSIYEWTAFKACLLGINTNKEEVLLTGVSTCFNGSWGVGGWREKWDRVSGLVIVSFTPGKKQHGERKDEKERETMERLSFIDLSLSLSGCRWYTRHTVNLEEKNSVSLIYTLCQTYSTVHILYTHYDLLFLDWLNLIGLSRPLWFSKTLSIIIYY